LDAVSTSNLESIARRLTSEDIIVRSPTISQGILGGLKNIIGGKIGSYTHNV
jgi:uncharacterized protein YbjQ (UPF0145 family)